MACYDNFVQPSHVIEVLRGPAKFHSARCMQRRVNSVQFTSSETCNTRCKQPALLLASPCLTVDTSHNERQRNVQTRGSQNELELHVDEGPINRLGHSVPLRAGIRAL